MSAAPATIANAATAAAIASFFMIPPILIFAVLYHISRFVVRADDSPPLFSGRSACSPTKSSAVKTGRARTPAAPQRQTDEFTL